ncbi:MAG: tyrosine-protein phosphatase, partial [Firmicutes bacterium]|nr:tyrosine-protein phosphatase [Bacillota bacterium]
MSTVISTYIPVEGLNNTRDLGGMITKDGRRIKPHRLIRSSRLSKLKDAEWISENVALAVDLRSSREIEEEPDPVIPGVEYLHLPIFELQAEGVTRDK